MLTIISVYTIKTNVAMCENSNALQGLIFLPAQVCERFVTYWGLLEDQDQVCADC
jgi:hypothetical protein